MVRRSGECRLERLIAMRGAGARAALVARGRHRADGRVGCHRRGVSRWAIQSACARLPAQTGRRTSIFMWFSATNGGARPSISAMITPHDHMSMAEP